MIRLRPSKERGFRDHGWLETRFSFSFADYFDPDQMGFRNLRVLNEDRIQPGKGFGMHPHKDMEIITYIVSGGLRHRDSLGNESIIRAGEVQRMTAGTGIMHSEFNASSEEEVHLLQIWIYPNREGLSPGYETRRLNPLNETASWVRVASPEGTDKTLKIHQNIQLLAARLDAGNSLSYTLSSGRHAWVQMLNGEATLNGALISAGDGVAVSDEPSLIFAARREAEILLFDLN